MKSVRLKLKISHHNCLLSDNILYGNPKKIVRTKCQVRTSNVVCVATVKLQHHAASMWAGES
jgi:hypothetical protein